MGPREDALAELDGLLRRAEEGLEPSACVRIVELVDSVPGRMRQAAHALGAQRSPAAVDALLALPPGVPGVVEGLFQAFYRGIRRERPDGGAFAAGLALDFPTSRASSFPETLDRARAAFGDGLERLRVGDKQYFRVRIPGPDPRDLAGRTARLGEDLPWLHRRLCRLRGTRLWLNGWCFPQDGPMRPAVQTHLVRAWLGWLETQADLGGGAA